MMARCLVFQGSRRSDMWRIGRCSSTIRFGASDDEVVDVLERQLDNRRTMTDNLATAPTKGLLTTKREALSLYREIVRITALFDWPNQQGRLWRDVLRESARQEFESARFEKDPELINRMLVVGRDAVHQIAERFFEKRKALRAADPIAHQ